MDDHEKLFNGQRMDEIIDPLRRHGSESGDRSGPELPLLLAVVVEVRHRCLGKVYMDFLL